jgi:hypothetical protein
VIFVGFLDVKTSSSSIKTLGVYVKRSVGRKYFEKVRKSTCPTVRPFVISNGQWFYADRYSMYTHGELWARDGKPRESLGYDDGKLVIFEFLNIKPRQSVK